MLYDEIDAIKYLLKCYDESNALKIMPYISVNISEIELKLDLDEFKEIESDIRFNLIEFIENVLKFKLSYESMNYRTYKNMMKFKKVIT